MKRFSLMLVCTGLAIISCRKEPDTEIMVETLPVEISFDQNSNTAVVTVSAAITGDESSVHERGFILSKDGPYNTQSVTPMEDGTPFSLVYNDLEVGQQYYVKAYVRSFQGPRYGKNMKFIVAASPVFENLTEESDVFGTYLNAKAKVLSSGGSSLDRYGFKIAAGQDSKIFEAENIDGEGFFSVFVNGLEPETEYELVAFAETVLGENYGEPMKFRTKKLAEPSAEIDVNDPFPFIGSMNIRVKVNLISDGNDGNVKYGVKWGEEMAALDNIAYISGNGTSGEIEIVDLERCKTYYFAGYAENGFGNRTGEVKSAATKLEYPPVVITEEPVRQQDYFDVMAVLRGNISDNGGRDVNECGFYLGTNPDVLDRKIVAENLDESGNFSSEVSGLTPLTKYYYKAFADNGEESVGSEVRHFVTGIADRDVYARDAQMEFTETRLVYWELEPINVTIDGKNVDLVFLDRNLGATKVAESMTYDYLAAGAYYRWGSYDVQVSPEMAFLATQSEDRLVPSVNGVPWNGWGEKLNYQGKEACFWSALATEKPDEVKNPCPDGYRIPTRSEFQAACRALNCNTAEDIASKLRICITGDFNHKYKYENIAKFQMWTDESLKDTGNSNPLAIIFSSSKPFESKETGARKRAMTIRCIKEY